MLTSNGSGHIELTANILWQLWKAINRRHFENPNNSPMKTVQHSYQEQSDFWTDWDWSSGQELVELKWLGQWLNIELGTEELAAATAIKLTTVKAAEEGYQDIILESDCKAVMNKLSSKNCRDAAGERVLEDILALSPLFLQCEYSYGSKNINATSHQVANFATQLGKDIRWKNFRPMWIPQVTTVFCKVSWPLSVLLQVWY